MKVDSMFRVKDLEVLGYAVWENALDIDFVRNIETVVDTVLLGDKFAGFLGIGNQSERNGTFFTGNLLTKDRVFRELLSRCQSFVDDVDTGKNMYLSEFMIVSSKHLDTFEDWWHQDFPFTNENRSVYTKHAIGMFVPITKFDSEHGSTRVLPRSHNDEYLDKTRDPRHIVADLGDIVVYDPRLFHSGSSNATDKVRNLIVIIFSRKELIPFEDFEFQFRLLWPWERNDPLVRSLRLRRHRSVLNTFGRNRTWINHRLFLVRWLTKVCQLSIRLIFTVGYRVKELLFYSMARLLIKRK
jgi:ectoine hydroxylase-related dioxygenase (phytanoyl-CoA dioxygenase family)